MAVGKIVKPFGIRGELVVLPMTSNPARFRKLKQVLIGPTDAQVAEYGILSARVEPRGVRISIQGIADRNDAEQLVGSFLFVDEKDAVRLPKGTHFVHDIIGLRVIGENNETIGVVKDVLKYPANDVYVVERNGNEVLLPAVKEFIKRIDMESRTMKVRLIEGMLDESAGETEEHDAD
ncbi:MAG: 16S rRNA processing protein RimM [Bacteroidetes bacterium]|nr:16S rRNA processing protein RimM [Bacteroidota bacterium]MCW5895814.1 16S rRNA processing protein RimM [Bacteroidota bacterium]